MKGKLVFYKQLSSMDCGPTCLRMIANYYGRHLKADSIRQLIGFSKAGVTMLGISEAAEKIGFSSRGVKINYDKLTQDAQLPCIIHWNQKHFVVLISQKKSFLKKIDILTVADPAKGILNYKKDEFLTHWIGTQNESGEELGNALLLYPRAGFNEEKNETDNKVSWALVLQYLANSKWQVTQVFIALLIASLFQLILPFLTKSLVDIGINTENLQFITIVLMAQIMLLFSKAIVDFIRSRLLLEISSIINLSILSDFWIKLTHLPISYFNSYHTGDTIQRITDNKKVQSFLTGSVLNTLFSILTFVTYAILLMFYNVQLFLIFGLGSFLYFLWITLFLRIKRKLNYQTFYLQAKENNMTLQLIQGMQEVKLNNAEQLKRWEWENIQAQLYKLNYRELSYNQLQQAGALLINQGKDVVITFLVAQLVIKGQLTLGTMLAVQYMIGQLNSPVEQLIVFIQNAQDAKISLERLNEVHQLKNEEETDKLYVQELPNNRSINMVNLSFTYPGSGNEAVLRNINMEIPEGKTLAIVGASGSGKTTLLKMMLKFYDNYDGDIKIGNSNLKYISATFWRKQCGSVLQDGFIFNDSIARNIAIGDEVADYNKLIIASKKANILSFIESLPNGFNTKLGTEGMGISQGQKQRILIARAIYKDPLFLFFDEATNSLDANNEKTIVENLQEFFSGRTVIIVAHRLSTVKNSDKIVVLHEGSIVEEGTHAELCMLNGKYFELVKNQLELGS